MFVLQSYLINARLKSVGSSIDSTWIQICKERVTYVDNDAEEVSLTPDYNPIFKQLDKLLISFMMFVVFVNMSEVFISVTGGDYRFYTCLSVCPSVHKVFRTFFRYVHSYWIETLYMTLYLWLTDQVQRWLLSTNF
jgi:hypothetical protein